MNNWFKTGFASLAVGGLFAVLLVLARTPSLAAHLPFVDFFHTALVVHVDLTVLVWFLANACLIWQLYIYPSHSESSDGYKAGDCPPPEVRRDVPRSGTRKKDMLLVRNFIKYINASGIYSSKIAQILMAIGMALMVVSGFLPDASPLMNNYVPVLQNDIFMASLFFIGTSVFIQASKTAIKLPASAASCAIWSAALILITSVIAVAASYFMLPKNMDAENYYEMLFWGGGHILQFVHTQMLAFVWLWLAGNGREASETKSWFANSSSNKGIDNKWRWFLLLPLLTVPISVLPYMHGNITDGFYYNFFTQLMIWGNGAYLLPVALFTIIKTISLPKSPVKSAMISSLLLFAAGGLISLKIEGVNVIIPAHYHGSIVGVSLAYMALWYHLLGAEGKMAFWQPIIYGGGQLLHITGLMISGGYEVARKTVELSPDAAFGAKFGMGLMGAGGMIAIIGGLMFVLVVWRLFKQQKPLPEISI